MHLNLKIALVLFAFGLMLGCDDEPGATIDAQPGDGQILDAGATDVGAIDARVIDARVIDGPDMRVPGDPVFASRKNNLRFKRVRRLVSDYARALELAPETLCQELGLYPCVDVHKVPLGGIDPFESGLYNARTVTSVTAPMAVDRIVLRACATRRDLDVAQPANAVVWGGIEYDAAGRLVDPDSPAVRAALDTLYTRMVLRHATEAELGHLRALYDEVVVQGEPRPASDWAVLACYVVLTSVEAVFY